MKKIYLGLILIFIFLLSFFFYIFSSKTYGSPDPLYIWKKEGENLRVWNNSWKEIKVTRARISDFKVHPGDRQRIWIEVESERPIIKANMLIKTDSLERIIELKKIDEKQYNGKYLSLFYFEWKVNDVSYGQTYTNKVDLVDNQNKSITWLFSWWDGPSGEFLNCQLYDIDRTRQDDDIYKFVYSSYNNPKLAARSLGDTCSINKPWGMYTSGSYSLTIYSNTTIQLNSSAKLIIPANSSLNLSQPNITFNIVSGAEIRMKTTPLLYDGDGDGVWDSITTSGGSIPASNSNDNLDCDALDSTRSVWRTVYQDYDHDGYAAGASTSLCLNANTSTAQQQAFWENYILSEATSDQVSYFSKIGAYGGQIGMVEKNFVLENFKEILKKVILENFLKILVKEVYARPPCEKAYDDCILSPPPPGDVSWTITTDQAWVNVPSGQKSKWLILSGFSVGNLPTHTRIQKLSFSVSRSSGSSATLDLRLAYYENNTWGVANASKSLTITPGPTSFSIDFNNTPFESGFYIRGSDVKNGNIGLAIRVLGGSLGSSLTVYFNNQNTMNAYYFIPGYKGSNDCYDQNPDVFPGQTAYFGVHRGDGSFDYNCDGTSTQLEPNTCSGSLYSFKFKDTILAKNSKNFYNRIYSLIDNLVKLKQVFSREGGSGGSYYVCWVYSNTNKCKVTPPSCGSQGYQAYFSNLTQNCTTYSSWSQIQLCK